MLIFQGRTASVYSHGLAPLFPYAPRTNHKDPLLTASTKSDERARAIAPQPNSRLLRLPTEIRLEIWTMVITDSCHGDDFAVEPHQCRDKFRDAVEDSDIIQQTLALSRVCRRLYVDTIHGALLYKTVPFRFESPDLFLRYVTAINPSLKDSIRDISFGFKMSKRHFTSEPQISRIKPLVFLPTVKPSRTSIYMSCSTKTFANYAVSKSLLRKLRCSIRCL